MIFFWNSSYWKLCASYIGAFLLLSACYHHLSQIPTKMQTPNKLARSGVIQDEPPLLPIEPQLHHSPKENPTQPPETGDGATPAARIDNTPALPHLETLDQPKESNVPLLPSQKNSDLPIKRNHDLIQETEQISVLQNNLPEDRFAIPAPPLKSSSPRVALLLPLSGPHATLGQALLNAAQLALFHFASTEFELLTQDTKGTPDGAADAAALAIGDGASLILGPLFSSSVTAITPAAQAAGVSVISFSNDRRVASNNVFTMGFLPDEQVERVVRFAYEKGLQRFALLAPDNSYGRAIINALEKIADDLGVEVTKASFYDPNSEDFGLVVRDLANYDQRRDDLLNQRKILEKRSDDVAQKTLKRLENLHTVGDLPFDALMVADSGKRLQAIAALLPYYDIDPKKTRMLGTGQWDAEDSILEPALKGGWFAAPPVKERQSFVQNYEEMFGDPPPRLATLAYDATALSTVFVKPDGSFDPSEITTSQGFAGRDGIFRFTPDGYAQRGLSIYQIKERRSQVIDIAPVRFQDNPH